MLFRLRVPIAVFVSWSIVFGQVVPGTENHRTQPLADLSTQALMATALWIGHSAPGTTLKARSSLYHAIAPRVDRSMTGHWSSLGPFHWPMVVLLIATPVVVWGLLLYRSHQGANDWRKARRLDNGRNLETLENMDRAITQDLRDHFELSGRIIDLQRPRPQNLERILTSGTSLLDYAQEHRLIVAEVNGRKTVYFPEGHVVRIDKGASPRILFRKTDIGADLPGSTAASRLLVVSDPDRYQIQVYLRDRIGATRLGSETRWSRGWDQSQLQLDLNKDGTLRSLIRNEQFMPLSISMIGTLLYDAALEKHLPELCITLRDELGLVPPDDELRAELRQEAEPVQLARISSIRLASHATEDDTAFLRSYLNYRSAPCDTWP